MADKISLDRPIDWADIAFSGPKHLRGKASTFIAAPRKMSNERIRQTLKDLLPKGPIIWGIAKEDYILGLENQPQFISMSQDTILPWAQKVNRSGQKMYVLKYSQSDLAHVVKAARAGMNIFVRGSWHGTLHTSPVYYAMASRGLKYTQVSPFESESAAKDYAQNINLKTPRLPAKAGEKELMQIAAEAAKLSFDSGFQTGAVLAKNSGSKYQPIDQSHNAIVPYETYAWHHGMARDDNLSPPGDLNHYDTVHAETHLLIKVGAKRAKGSSLFIPLMPCPTCARNIISVGLAEVYYHLDHSQGYALKMFQEVGIKSIRMTP